MKKISSSAIALVMISVFTLCLMSCFLKSKSFSHYGYTTMDVPGSQGTNAHGISNSGVIAGLQSVHGGANGYLYEGGHFKPLRFSDRAYFTAAYDINDSGMIVGEYRDDQGNHGFMYNGNRYVAMDVPGFVYTEATGVNNAGMIVGRCSNHRYGSGPSRGFLYNQSEFILLDFPGALSTSPQGINDAGTVVGWYITESGDHKGFLYKGGRFAPFEFNVPGAKYAIPHSINNQGLIAGTAFHGSGYTYRGVLYDGENFTTIHFPGAKDTYLSGINDKGVLVGMYKNDDGFEHGFVAAPSP